MEAFHFTRVCDLPKENKIPPENAGIINSKNLREVYEDGSFGG